MNWHDEEVWAEVARRIDGVSAQIVVPEPPNGATNKLVGTRGPQLRSANAPALAAVAGVAVLVATAASLLSQGDTPTPAGPGSGTNPGMNSTSSPQSQAAPTALPASPAGRVVELPTWPTRPEEGGCPQAGLAQVILRSDQSPDTFTVYVEGVTGTRYSVIWPFGYSGRYIEEFELVDETGSVVAREGDRLNLTGGRIDPQFDFYACRVEVAN